MPSTSTPRWEGRSSAISLDFCFLVRLIGIQSLFLPINEVLSILLILLFPSLSIFAPPRRDKTATNADETVQTGDWLEVVL